MLPTGYVLAPSGFAGQQVSSREATTRSNDMVMRLFDQDRRELRRAQKEWMGQMGKKKAHHIPTTVSLPSPPPPPYCCPPSLTTISGTVRIGKHERLYFFGKIPLRMVT